MHGKYVVRTGKRVLYSSQAQRQGISRRIHTHIHAYLAQFQKAMAFCRTSSLDRTDTRCCMALQRSQFSLARCHDLCVYAPAGSLLASFSVSLRHWDTIRNAWFVAGSRWGCAQVLLQEIVSVNCDMCRLVDDLPVYVTRTFQDTPFICRQVQGTHRYKVHTITVGICLKLLLYSRYTQHIFCTPSCSDGPHMA